MAGSEVIERDLDADRAQLGEDRRGTRRVTHGGLSDLDRELFRFYLECDERRTDVVAETRRDDLAGRRVDVQRDVDAAPGPTGEFATGAAQDLPAQRHDEP